MHSQVQLGNEFGKLARLGVELLEQIPLRITARCGKLTPPGETEAGNPGEERIAPTGTFRSAERRAKGYPGQAHQTMRKGRT